MSLVRALAALFVLGIPLFALAPSPAALASAGPAAPEPTQTQKAFAIYETSLKNGLHVVLEQDTRSPIVAVNMRYAAGTWVEPSGQRGIALLTQYMMREATAHVPAGGFDRLFGRVGGTDVSYGTNFDYTRFYATVPSNRLALALWILSDQMGFFAERVDAQLLGQQRRIELNERRQRIDDQVLGEVPHLVREAVYGQGHPYAASFYGDHGELGTITPQSLVDFFDAHFGPEAATLAIVGDFQRDEALALVEKYFGPIPRGLAPPPKAPPRPALTHETRLFVSAHMDHASVYVAWPIPSPLEEGAAELDVANDYLDGTATAKLHWRLVDDLHIATSARTTLERLQHGALFEIIADASGSHTAEELLAAIDDVLADVRASPIGVMATRKAILEAERPKLFGLERVGYRADVYARYAQLAGSAEAFMRDLTADAAVTPESLQRAIVTHLPRDRRVVVLATPSPDAPIRGVVTRQETR